MIRFLINIYIVIIIIDVVISYLPQVKNHPWAQLIRQVADFSEKPIRKVLPPDLPIDLSPLIVILGLNLLKVLW